MRLLSESNEELELELGHAYIIIYLNNLYLYIFCMKNSQTFIICGFKWFSELHLCFIDGAR